MSRIDKATVKSLELKAPRSSNHDADILRGQLRSGKIFSAFDEQERDVIWDRLQRIDGLIPSLYTFFKDVQYLQVCVNCIKRLTKVSPRETVLMSMKDKFTGQNQTRDQVKIQITENTYRSRPGTLKEQIDLGYRQLFACAMRHFAQMPKEPVKEDLKKKFVAVADKTVLSNFANLASQLGFNSREIVILNGYPNSKSTTENTSQGKPLLVTEGPDVARDRRYGVPRSSSYDETCNFLFIDHLHDEKEVNGESITSFFVQRSIYLAFFGRPKRSLLDKTANNQDLPPFDPRSQSSVLPDPQTDLTSRSESNYSGQQHKRPDPMEEDIDMDETFHTRPEDIIDHYTAFEEETRHEQTEEIRRSGGLSLTEWNY